MIEQPHAAAKQHRDQVNLDLIQQPGPQALLDGGGAHQADVLAACRRPCLRDGAHDAIGDEGVGRLAGRHGLRDVMCQDEQRHPGERARSSPCVGYVVGTAAGNDCADAAGHRVEDLGAGG